MDEGKLIELWNNQFLGYLYQEINLRLDFEIMVNLAQSFLVHSYPALIEEGPLKEMRKSK